MTTFNPKRLPVLNGCGDKALYVDDLVSVQEFGPVTVVSRRVVRVR
jgi:hypothetical protein